MGNINELEIHSAQCDLFIYDMLTAINGLLAVSFEKKAFNDKRFVYAKDKFEEVLSYVNEQRVKQNK